MERIKIQISTEFKFNGLVCCLHNLQRGLLRDDDDPLSIRKGMKGKSVNLLKDIVGSVKSDR